MLGIMVLPVSIQVVLTHAVIEMAHLETNKVPVDSPVVAIVLHIISLPTDNFSKSSADLALI